MKRLYLMLVFDMLLLGCSDNSRHPQSQFTPLENGFGFMSHSVDTYPMHKATWGDLVYRQAGGSNIIVWPYLFPIPGIEVHSNVVILIGGRAEPHRDGSERLAKRITAFTAPNGPRLDITEDVLDRYCRESNLTSTNIMKDSLVGITQTNDVLRIDFVILKFGLHGEGSINDADGIEFISWPEVQVIMDAVKAKGSVKREKWSGFEYLERE